MIKVVQLDNHYQVKIPPEARKALRLRRGEDLQLEIIGGKIVLSVPENKTDRFLGAGKGFWGDVDAYIEKERKWDD